MQILDHLKQGRYYSLPFTGKELRPSKIELVFQTTQLVRGTAKILTQFSMIPEPVRSASCSVSRNLSSGTHPPSPPLGGKMQQ